MVVIWAAAVVPIVMGLLWDWKYGATRVDYAPWMLDQADRGNVESLKVRGTRVEGRLRAAADFPALRRPIAVRRFVTEAPSMDEAARLVAALRERSGPGGGRPRVEWGPPASWRSTGWAVLVTSSTIAFVAAVPILAGVGYVAGYFFGFRDGRSTAEGGRTSKPPDAPLSDPDFPTP